MSEVIEALAGKVDARFGDRVGRLPARAAELAYECEAAQLLEVCRTLRDAAELKFEMLMDLAGVDHLHYGRDEWQTDSATRSGFSRGRVARSDAPDPDAPGRFAVVYNLLSITHNQRLRLIVRCPDATEPVAAGSTVPVIVPVVVPVVVQAAVAAAIVGTRSSGPIRRPETRERKSEDMTLLRQALKSG